MGKFTYLLLALSKLPSRISSGTNQGSPPHRIVQDHRQFLAGTWMVEVVSRDQVGLDPWNTDAPQRKEPKSTTRNSAGLVLCHIEWYLQAEFLALRA